MAITSLLVHPSPAASLGKWEFTWPRIMQIALQFCRFLTHPFSSTTHMKACSWCFRLPCRSFQKFKVMRKTYAEPCRSLCLGLNHMAVKVKLHSKSVPGVILCLGTRRWISFTSKFQKEVRLPYLWVAEVTMVCCTSLKKNKNQTNHTNQNPSTMVFRCTVW